MVYPSVYHPTTIATVLSSPAMPTAGMSGQLYRPVWQSFGAHPAGQPPFAAPQLVTHTAWAHPAVLADDRRTQRIALGLLLTVVLLGLPLAAFLGALAHH